MFHSNQSTARNKRYYPRAGDILSLRRVDGTLSFKSHASKDSLHIVWSLNSQDTKIVVKDLSAEDCTPEEQVKRFEIVASVFARSHGLLKADISETEDLLSAVLK
jgi:hypothetical protein